MYLSLLSISFDWLELKRTQFKRISYSVHRYVILALTPDTLGIILEYPLHFTFILDLWLKQKFTRL